MKIGITGDTHSSLQAMRRIVNLTPPVDLWLHTGDHAEDANLLHNWTGIKTVCVRGNCDIVANEAKVDEFLVLENFKVWLTHGHKYIQWNEKTDLGYWAKQLDQDIVIFGHTHVPMCEEYGDPLLINPGSPSRPRGGSKASFAVLTLLKGQLPEVEFFTL
ncbi:MAG: metallophosphoesterase [Phascolarctobacterium sp.]|nr:metallophosphoesterase [Phascolarctobacterium sp.]